MKYPFRVYQTQVEAHVFWVAESPCLKGCVGQGDSIGDAVRELEENEAVWLETAEEYRMEIPPVPVESMSEYSGKFTVRIAPNVHQTAAEQAKKENISLNQYVNDAIVAQNARLETASYIAPQVRDATDMLKSFILESPWTQANGSSQVAATFSLPQQFDQGGATSSGKIINFCPVAALN